MQKQKFLEKCSKKYLKEFVLKKPSKYYSLTRQDKGEGTARQHSFAPHHHQNGLMRMTILCGWLVEDDSLRMTQWEWLNEGGLPATCLLYWWTEGAMSNYFSLHWLRGRDNCIAHLGRLFTFIYVHLWYWYHIYVWWWSWSYLRCWK